MVDLERESPRDWDVKASFKTVILNWGNCKTPLKVYHDAGGSDQVKLPRASRRNQTGKDYNMLAKPWHSHKSLWPFN